MKKEQRRKLFRLWDILLSLLLVTAGLCLMVQCYGVYRGGAYTPETVAAAFRPIQGVVYACAGMTVLRLLGGFFEENVPAKSRQPLAMTYHRAAQRADMENCPQPEKDQILALRKSRRLRNGTGWVLFALCGGVFLAYALDSRHFTEDVTGSVTVAVRYLAAALALPFGWAVFAAYQNRASIERELALLGKAPKRAYAPAPARKNWLPILRGALLAAAVALVAVGLNLGGTRDVLTKAINICTECVGLG